jgi:hypothetical protein
MRRGYRYRTLLRIRRTQRVFRKLLPMLAGAGRVTVLLFLIVGSGAMHAALALSRTGGSNDGLNGVEDTNGSDLRAFEFTCDFHVPAGQGRLDGLMASNGSQHRIAIYWIEPSLLRESTSLLRYSDFLFTPELVHYWIHRTSQRGTFALSADPGDPLLPRQNSVESVVRSALAIVGATRCPPGDARVPLEVGRFFQESRGQAEYAYEVSGDGPDRNDLPGEAPSDAGILNALPYGREYSKRTQDDGALEWHARRALNNQPLISVTVKPLTGVKGDRCPDVFDAANVGQWTLVPGPYRRYWSFDLAYSQLGALPDVRTASLALHDRIESYLADRKEPVDACRGLSRLCFKTAMMTQDTDRIRRSTQAAVEWLCLDPSIDSYQCLFEFARIAGAIEQEYPRQAQQWLPSLVEQIIRHTAYDTMRNLERLITTVDANRWSIAGKLLLEEVRRRHLAKEDAVNALSARLQASRIARSREPPDPCEFPPSVRQYLAQLDACPPKGTLDMNDVRRVLDDGLARCFNQSRCEEKQKVIENTLRSIRLIAGDGPFCGDEKMLIASVEQFAGRYLLVRRPVEPIDTTLAVLLGLAFCDISTPDDHTRLLEQFHQCCVDLQSKVNAMLRERKLNELVLPEDVEREFARYERLFRRYVDDPLWPAFKFPWTCNERSRLIGSLGQRLTRLATLLDEMSLKVKYGGASPELKRKTMYEISSTAQQLVPEAAHLRKPPYPGISLQYRGAYGFTVVIRGPLYEENDRPKDKFRVMKYFHLGHRLEDVVARERELIRPTRKQEQEQ